MNFDANFGSVARTFVDARRDSHVVATYPGSIPETLEQAYAIQDDAIRLVGKPISGWKVGRIPDRLIEQYGANRLVGPIFSHMVIDAEVDAHPCVPLLQGFAAVEAELLLRVGSAIPPGAGLIEVADYIDEVRFGLEIASSPFPEINDHGPAVTASDFGNNFGLVLGPRISDWRSRDLISAPVSLAIDGETAGTGTCATMLDGPFGAVAFLARLLSDRGIGLPAGTWVSTGAITGVHRITPGQSATAIFDSQFEVSCRTRLFAPAALSRGAA